MNPLRWLAVRLSGYAYKASTPRGLSLIGSYLAGVLWTFEATWSSLVKETYGKNPVAYSCVRLLSQSVPEARLTAYTGEGDKRKELPSAHPLRALLKRPNELMTRFEADELTTIQMSVVGRSVWWKERSNGGGILALWPLRPDRVGPVYSNSDQPGQRVISGYAYLPPNAGTPILLPRRDCLAFNFPDPDGESGGIVEGFGPLAAVSRQVAADNKATDHVGALLANYAQPGVAIRVTDPVPDEETANLIKAKFRQEFGGTRLGMPAILDAGAEIQTLGFTLRDLEFPELRANAEARICGALGVPPILAGTKVGMDRNTYSNSQEARAFFAETTLSWYWRRYADQYTSDLASEFGEDITCEYDTFDVRALAGQKIERITPIKDAFTAGVVTRNQYRHALGLDPLEPAEGDVFLVPNSVTVTPATDKARAAIEARKPKAPELPAPAPVLMPPAPQNGQQQINAGQQQGGQPGEAQATEGQEGRQVVRKSADVIIIPLDGELAAALGVPAEGYLVARDGHGN